MERKQPRTGLRQKMILKYLSGPRTRYQIYEHLHDFGYGISPITESLGGLMARRLVEIIEDAAGVKWYRRIR